MVSKFGRGEYDFESMNRYLNEEKVSLIYVGNKYGSLEDADDDNKIVIMTYHSAKGLDFDAVCLPFIDVDLNITTNENALILSLFLGPNVICLFHILETCIQVLTGF